LWTKKPNVKRYYFLTKNDISGATGSWGDRTALITTIRSNNSTLWGSSVVEIPAMARGSYNKFYIVNDI